MPNNTVDLAPYRHALEAIISHHPPAKLSAMLGHAAANLDDPWLREQLKSFIQRLPRMADQTPIRILDYMPDKEQVLDVMAYIEGVIDAQERAWEVIAESYGWKPQEPGLQ